MESYMRKGSREMQCKPLVSVYIDAKTQLKMSFTNSDERQSGAEVCSLYLSLPLSLSLFLSFSLLSCLNDLSLFFACFIRFLCLPASNLLLYLSE